MQISIVLYTNTQADKYSWKHVSMQVIMIAGGLYASMQVDEHVGMKSCVGVDKNAEVWVVGR